MRKHFFSLWLFLGLCNVSNAWENKLTHPAITERAVNSSEAKIDDYLKTQLGLSGGLSTQLHWDFPSDIELRMTSNNKVEPTKTKTILDWLKAGSSIEDEDGRWWPIRPRHHFYDPTRNSGLDNQSDHPEWEQYACSQTGFDFTGLSALDWATAGIAQKDPRNNHDKWGTARTIFYQALTEQDSAIREARLAESLMKLGCVMHLLEDQGVPAHTRNDFLFSHYRTWYDHGNDLENDIEKRASSNGGWQWIGTSPVIFNTVAKYFDTDSRNADAYLGNGNTPPVTWGLSECTNYQFLSYSTIFVPNNGSLYYFPHPSLSHIDNFTVENNKMYYNGSNYGVPHMARALYTYYKIIYGGYTVPPSVVEIIDNQNTTDDEKVFADYANITIPRTIDYVTGLANYFFRGKLKVTYNGDDGSTAHIAIKNKSMNGTVEQTLIGGTFELYWEDADGDRTPVSISIDGGWNSGSTLSYGDTVTATFNVASQAAGKYILVYKGNICENPADLDASDSQALATDSFGPSVFVFIRKYTEDGIKLRVYDESWNYKWGNSLAGYSIGWGVRTAYDSLGNIYVRTQGTAILVFSPDGSLLKTWTISSVADMMCDEENLNILVWGTTDLSIYRVPLAAPAGTITDSYKVYMTDVGGEMWIALIGHNGGNFLITYSVPDNYLYGYIKLDNNFNVVANGTMSYPTANDESYTLGIVSDSNDNFYFAYQYNYYDPLENNPTYMRVYKITSANTVSLIHSYDDSFGGGNFVNEKSSLSIDEDAGILRLMYGVEDYDSNWEVYRRIRIFYTNGALISSATTNPDEYWIDVLFGTGDNHYVGGAWGYLVDPETNYYDYVLRISRVNLDGTLTAQLEIDERPAYAFQCGIVAGMATSP